MIYMYNIICLVYKYIYNELYPKKQVSICTNRGIVPIYVAYSVKSWFKKKSLYSPQKKEYRIKM